jgi:hypothetical protein
MLERLIVGCLQLLIPVKYFSELGVFRYFLLFLAVILVGLAIGHARAKPINTGKWACILISMAFCGEFLWHCILIFAISLGPDPSTRGLFTYMVGWLVPALIALVVSGRMWWRFNRKQVGKGIVRSQGEMAPPIDCPGCGQETANLRFCEACGRIIREFPPPPVLPDSMKTEWASPNKSFQTDPEPRERGSGPLNSNR